MTKTMTKTKRLMIDLAEIACLRNTRSIRPTTGFCATPGAFIKRLSDKQRALLRELRSDELANVKPYW